MFVHWGLYSIPAGEWNRERSNFLSEWVMYERQIPIREYEQLAKNFNPTNFDAEEWVSLAKNAGMNYLVFTAKHHDGFAMWHSSADAFNIVDSTPFARDPIGDLSRACQDKDLGLCLYYSQAMDWHEGQAAGYVFPEELGNHWDFPEEVTERGFKEYMNRKVKPQLAELLTRYGPIRMMWFDMPVIGYGKEDAQEINDLVRRLQPGCLISNRIWKDSEEGLGDVMGWGDNYLPSKKEQRLGEACFSLQRDSWGYKKHGSWVSEEELSLSKEQAGEYGYNLLVNVGPKSDGNFPKEAIALLKNSN